MANLHKKSQSSFEYLAIFGIGLIVLIPFIYLFQQYSTASSQQITYSSISAIGNDIINTAEAVYYMGPPAKLTLFENFPSGIFQMNSTTNWATQQNWITFSVSGGSNLNFFTKVNLAVNITNQSFTPGMKRITLQAINQTGTHINYVQISFS
jgi:hypothetical protein